MLRTAAPKVMWVGRARILALWLLALLVAASIGMLLTAKDARADTISVNSMEDAGDNDSTDGECDTRENPQPNTEPICTLRAAIEEANFNGETDTIIFDPALSGTITLTLGRLRIFDSTPPANDLDIQGPGARKITVSGNDASTVFFIDQAVSVTMSGLTISDGSTAGNGGGIYNHSGTVKLANTTVSGNTANGAGGGGGIYTFNGTLELANTTVSGNSASGGGGGGIYNSDGTLELSNSTVSSNTAFGGSGGIHIAFSEAKATLANTTVSGNTATADGSFGGGIISFDSTVNLSNTIVARNTAPTDPDARGTFASQGNNLIGNTTGATGFVASDLKNVLNPLLGPLQNNGGPTNTHALLPGSPAVDAGRNTACPFTDQRGILRKDGDKNGSVICDIGAFERNDLSPPKVTTTIPTDGKTGVERHTDLTASFSERMDRATLTTSTFKLFKVNRDGSTTQITNVTLSSTTEGLKATLDPFGSTSTTQLAANTEYEVVVTTAAKDRAGNRLDQSRTASGNQPKEWTFTTGSI